MKYGVFVIDPPWMKKKGGIRQSRPNQDRKLDYPTLLTEDIFHLLDNEIFTLAEVDHAVFMWTVDQYLFECDSEMKKRGYKRHCFFIWDKENGVAPAFTVRYSHEYLIWYYKPKMIPISKEFQGKYTTVLREKSRQHSRKPDLAYRMIDDFYPNENKIDVFSREKRKWFDQFGNETDYFK